METSFKNWLCPNFLSLPKKSELPKLWGGAAAPLAPPARTPMNKAHYWFVCDDTLAMFVGTGNFCHFCIFSARFFPDALGMLTSFRWNRWTVNAAS